MSVPSQSEGPRGVTMSKKRITKSKRAGVNIPVGKIYRSLRQGRYANRISPGAAVYVAGAIEYLVDEVLNVAAIETTNSSRKLITPRHISLSVRKDAELNELFRGVMIPQGGVVPFVPLMKRSKKSKPDSKVDAKAHSQVDAEAHSQVDAEAHSQVDAQPDVEMDA